MGYVGSGGMCWSRAISRRFAVLIMIAWAGSAWPVLGQFEIRGQVPRASTKVYFDTSHKADADLRSADNHAKAGDYAEAIEIYQRVLQQFGDKVVDVAPDPNAAAPEDDSRLSVNARRQECQRRGSRPCPPRPGPSTGPGSTRRPSAGFAWDGKVAIGPCSAGWSTRRSAAPGETTPSNFLATSPFQDGQFAEAIVAYTQLVPDRPSGNLGLIHFDPERSTWPGSPPRSSSAGPRSARVSRLGPRSRRSPPPIPTPPARSPAAKGCWPPTSPTRSAKTT